MDKLSFFEEGRGHSRAMMATTFYSQLDRPLPPFNRLPPNTSFEQANGIPNYSLPPQVPSTLELRKLLRHPYHSNHS